MAKQAEEEERSKKEDRAARVVQRAWKRHDEWKKMTLRFSLRRKVWAMALFLSNYVCFFLAVLAI